NATASPLATAASSHVISTGVDMTAKATSCWARRSSLRRRRNLGASLFPAATAVEHASGERAQANLQSISQERSSADYGRRGRRPWRPVSPERITGSDGRGGRFHCGPISLKPALTRWACATRLRARAVAHHADGVELGLLVVLRPFAHLVALAEQ